MTCRCPACDQVLLIDESIGPDTILCCDRCDRGFRAPNTRCEHCSGSNPFITRDYLTFHCSACGAAQYDPHHSVRMTA